jgi:hypothetical protein
MEPVSIERIFQDGQHMLQIVSESRVRTPNAAGRSTAILPSSGNARN